MTTSLQVAEYFGKRHAYTLEAIENLVTENSVAKKYFQESTYENRGKQYPMYIINRDGFVLLAMGFTGKKAIQFKIQYIKQFNGTNKCTLQETMPLRVLSTHLEGIVRLVEMILNKRISIIRTRYMTFLAYLY